MNIIKKVIYGASSMALLAPFATFAQTPPPATKAEVTAFAVPTTTGLPAGSLVNIVTQVMNWLLYAVGLFGVIGFVIAGILYLTAAGDDEQIKKAKKAMVYSIVGVIVALVGVVVITAVKGALSGSTSAF
jgi:cytochrome bd-type quinol oxidase subunit 2